MFGCQVSENVPVNIIQVRQLEASCGFSFSSLRFLLPGLKSSGELEEPMRTKEVRKCASYTGLRNVSQSVESIWPVSSVAQRATPATVAIAAAVAHWGVGAAVATAHAVPQRVAVAAPVAAWEDRSGEVVTVHVIRRGGFR